MTSNWFPFEERTYATMVGTCANVFGMFLGFLFPAIQIKGYEPDKEYSHNQIDIFREEVRNMLVLVAIFGSVALALTIIFFKSKPENDNVHAYEPTLPIIKQI